MVESVPRRRRAALFAAVTLALVGLGASPAPVAGFTPVIVIEEFPGSAAAAVARFGGTPGAQLPLVEGLAASVPTGSLGALASAAGVAGLLPDANVRLNLLDLGGGGGGSTSSGPVFAATVDAPKAWSAGYRGKVGVNVAILDSGIAPVKDLTSPSNRIVGWKDFVGGSSVPVDPHGHGTYIAGVVAGNGSLSNGKWVGIAPAAGVVGIRVFDALGLATASRVIQGIQWAIDNKKSLGIRVLNMSFSTNADLSYRFDAVAYAAEQAWKAGIVVVASAGNLGPLPATVLSPGIDPFLVTAGATDDRGTVSRSDDRIADFSGRGPTLDLVSKPELVAPGVWVTGLKMPGSTVALENPLSTVDQYYFEGSGTSPATAVVSGVVALALQKRPKLVPDQVKFVLVKSGTKAPGSLLSLSSDPIYVNAYNAVMSKLNDRANKGLTAATGGGLLSLVGIPDVKWR
ncbi:MAG TPA: S8 family peptidase [Actinomycetota bacterium]